MRTIFVSSRILVSHDTKRRVFFSTPKSGEVSISLDEARELALGILALWRSELPQEESRITEEMNAKAAAFLAVDPRQIDWTQS